MEITAELKHLLRALRLSPLLATLPERAAYAKGNRLTHLEFLELVLSDATAGQKWTHPPPRIGPTWAVIWRKASPVFGPILLSGVP